MRKTISLMAISLALALSAPTAALANGAVTTTADQDFACEAGVTYKTITIVSSDVTIDGCTFDGGGSTPAAIRNLVTGFSNVTITNSTFEGYTGRTISFGFADGPSLANDRASNVTISNNDIGDMVGNAATSIAVFDTDGVTIVDNTISNADPLFTGRRGINLDSSSAVSVKNNTVSMGASGKLGGGSFPADFPVFVASPWAIQVAMSNAPAVDYAIINNTISGSYDGIVILSQQDATGLTIVGNTLATGSGVRFNAGSATAGATSITYSDINVSGNRHDATAFDQTTDWFSNGVRLQNSKPSTYSDVKITGNRTVNGTEAVFIAPSSANGEPTLENVLIKGNR